MSDKDEQSVGIYLLINFFLVIGLIVLGSGPLLGSFCLVLSIYTWWPLMRHVDKVKQAGCLAYLYFIVATIVIALNVLSFVWDIQSKVRLLMSMS